MDVKDIEDKVCTVLADKLSVSRDQVSPQARLQEDLDADSLDLYDAVMALEDEFGVSIPEEEVEGVKTVGQAIQLVASKLGVPA